MRILGASACGEPFDSRRFGSANRRNRHRHLAMARCFRASELGRQGLPCALSPCSSRRTCLHLCLQMSARQRQGPEYDEVVEEAGRAALTDAGLAFDAVEAYGLRALQRPAFVGGIVAFTELAERASR